MSHPAKPEHEIVVHVVGGYDWHYDCSCGDYLGRNCLAAWRGARRHRRALAAARQAETGEITWASPWRRRCPAYAVVTGSGYRCDRPRGHAGPHASERGMDTPTWREVWTDDAGRVVHDPGTPRRPYYGVETTPDGRARRLS